MAAFTMAMLLGIAVMQWVTGLVAQTDKAQGVVQYTAVLLTAARMLGSRMTMGGDVGLSV